MGKTTFKTMIAAALVAVTALTFAVPAEAGRGGHGRGGYGGGHHHYHGGGNALGAGLLGFGIGAIVGTALAPREVYVAPPPPPPAYYAPVSYGPPAWSPDWYTYCYSRYRSFDARTGYFMGYDGYPHFCQ